MSNNFISKKESGFCKAFVKTGDFEKSLLQSGYELNPKSLETLSRPKIIEEVENRGEKERNLMAAVTTAGYRRIAFGSIADSVRLLYLSNPTKEQLDALDLFMISEIRVGKDGKVEMKFYDRLLALDRLNSGYEKKADTSFFEALHNSANIISKEATDDEIL